MTDDIDFAALWKATAKKLAGEVREVDLINDALRQTIGTLARQRDQEKRVRLQGAAEILRQREINRMAELQYQELQAGRDALEAELALKLDDLETACIRFERAEQERDALRTAIQEANDLLAAVHCGQDDHDDALGILSRVIDTKEKPDDPA